jgi:hypothetical protein
MATVVNNPSGTTDSGGGMGFLMGVILLIVVGFFLVYYGIPALNRSSGNTTPQVNVPGKIDVNVQNPSGGSGQ